MRNKLSWLAIGALIVVTAPLGVYVMRFHHMAISTNPDDWADFGQYVDGTVGAILGAVNLMVIVLVAVLVHRLETKREHDMVRPFAYINVGDYEDDIYVKIQNHGLGPMVIKKFICYAGDDTENATVDLVDLVTDLNSVIWTTFTINGPPEVIPAGGESVLIQYAGDSDDHDYIINSVRRQLQ